MRFLFSLIHQELRLSVIANRTVLAVAPWRISSLGGFSRRRLLISDMRRGGFHQFQEQETFKVSSEAFGARSPFNSKQSDSDL